MATLGEVAAQWSRMPEMEGWEPLLLEKLIGDLRMLAREALAEHKHLFLWGSLSQRAAAVGK